MSTQQNDYGEQVKQWEAARKNLYDRSTKYIQLVFGIGYAGFFGVWAGTRQQLHTWEVVLSASLVLVSLLAYLAYEILAMWSFSQMMLKASKVITDDRQQFYSAVETYVQQETVLMNRLVRLQYLVFWFTLITGFGGGLVLLAAFLRRLWAIAHGG